MRLKLHRLGAHSLLLLLIGPRQRNLVPQSGPPKGCTLISSPRRSIDACASWRKWTGVTSVAAYHSTTEPERLELA